MEKIKRIWIPVVVVVFMAGGFLFWMIHREDADALKIEVEDVPCGLEWGMSEEEVKVTLNVAGYQEVEVAMEIDGVVYYEIPAYQGIPGAGCLLQLKFNEDGRLRSAAYCFRQDASIGPLVSEDMMDDLQIAFVKAYEKKSEEVFVNPDPIGAQKYCLHSKSLIDFNCRETLLTVDFSDRADETTQKIIEELRILFGE